MLASASLDETIKLWDVVRGQLLGSVAEVVEISGGVISGLLQRARLGGETPKEIIPADSKIDPCPCPMRD